MPYVNYRWLGGMITNYKTIKNSIKRLKDLEFLAEENFFQFSKKEGLMMKREMQKLELSLGGIKNVNGIPDVVFVIDIGYEKNAVREAQALNLPIVGVVDTNHNPDGIDYVIAGNDDSIKAINYYAREIADTILETKASIATHNIEAKTTVQYSTEKTDAKNTKAKKQTTDNKKADITEKEDVVKKQTTDTKKVEIAKKESVAKKQTADTKKVDITEKENVATKKLASENKSQEKSQEKN